MEKKEKAAKELEWIERYTSLLDTKFTIPGTRIHFGIDPILGLIPGVGDAISLGMSGILVLAMMRHGASGKVVVKMLLNLAIDTLIGSIPLLGTIFDIFYKANVRNLRLLREHYGEDKHQGSGCALLITVLTIILLLIVLLIWGLVALLSWIF